MKRTNNSTRPDAVDRFPTDGAVPRHRWYLHCKAVGDRVAALVLLVVASPLILVAALLMRLTSHGFAFYCQTRLGRNGREFTLYKIRTMVHDAEADTGPVWADRNDSRVTPLGRFLRSTHIDELPQLVNVLLGHMSLVGPRPERPELASKLDWSIPEYGHRLSIRPGMTGLAQLRLPPDTSLESVRQKLEYDLYYIEYASPWLDSRVLFVTSLRLLLDVARALWSPTAPTPRGVGCPCEPLDVVVDGDCEPSGGLDFDDPEWDGADPVASRHHLDPKGSA